MAKFILHQGDVNAKLFAVAYQPAEGFQEGNTWQVAEASLSAKSDTKLTNGPATIEFGGTKFPITVTVLDLERLPEESGPACSIEIGYAEGLPKLALALGLLEHLTPKQRQAIVGQ